MKTYTKFASAFILTAALSFGLIAQNYCIPPGFKSMGGQGEPFTFISNVQLQNLNNSSGMPTGQGDDNGYTYYESAPNPVLEKGSTYSLKVTSNDNLNAGMEVVVWVDWNGDKEFNSSGERVAHWAMAGNHGMDITVPKDAANGKVRMRVYCDMPPQMGHIPAEPCGYLNQPSHPIGQHGEVEDYDLQIGTPTGIERNEASAEFKLYPNPTSNVLNISRTESKSSNYIVYDMNARQVMKGIINNKIENIDVSGLTTGKYILMIQGDAHTVHRPFHISR